LFLGNVGVGRRIIPMVAFLFQGELEDLQRIKAYLENGVPVVVMEGCGGLGDVITAAVDDRFVGKNEKFVEFFLRIRISARKWTEID
jgi:hypothetical protein